MTKKLKVKSPKGTFPAYIEQIQTGLFIASVLHHTKQAGNPTDETDFGTMVFDLHTEHAPTEHQAMEALRQWCETGFGRPCSIS
jgi:hypothetical protein